MDMDKPKINMRAWEPIEKRKGQANKPSISDKNKNTAKQPIIFKEFRSDPIGVYLDELENKKNDSLREKIHANSLNNPRYDIYIEETRKKSRYKSNNNFLIKLNPQLLKFILASVGAIGMGLIFGLIILNLADQPLEQQTSTTNQQINVDNNNLGNGVIDNQQSIAVDQTIYLLQAGVFSEQSGAQTILQGQKNSGKTAVISGSGPYYVFVGMATTKTEADALKGLLIQDGSDIFVKQYTIPASQPNLSSSAQETFANWAQEGEKLVEVLSTGSVNLLTGAVKTLDNSTVQKLHQQFLLFNQELKNKLNTEGKANFLAQTQLMAEQLNYAVTALSEFQKNPNKQYLWLIQEQLIAYKLNYAGLANY